MPLLQTHFLRWSVAVVEDDLPDVQPDWPWTHGMTKYRTDRTGRETAAGKAYRYHSDPVINLYTACRASHDDSTRTFNQETFFDDGWANCWTKQQQNSARTDKFNGNISSLPHRPKWLICYVTKCNAVSPPPVYSPWHSSSSFTPKTQGPTLTDTYHRVLTCAVNNLTVKRRVSQFHDAQWLAWLTFYPRNAQHSAVLAVVRCLSVRLAVRHTPVLCLNGSTYLVTFSTVW